MKILKNVGGILLGVIGAEFLVSGMVEVISPRSQVSGGVIAIIFLLGLLLSAGAVALLKRSVTELRPAQCTNCGSAEQAPAGVLRRSHNPWLYHLCGWMIASLWGSSRQQQVRCVQCETLYFTETRATRIAGILLWVFILFVSLNVLLNLLVQQ